MSERACPETLTYTAHLYGAPSHTAHLNSALFCIFHGDIERLDGICSRLAVSATSQRSTISQFQCPDDGLYMAHESCGSA